MTERKREKGLILGVAQGKGGVGKTTIATNLAVMTAMAGKDVLLIDTDDKQQSIAGWSGVRQAGGLTPFIPVVSRTGKFGPDAVALANKFDLVIIDVGGRDALELRTTLSVADRVVMPLMPSSFDVWSMNNMTQEIREISQRLEIDIDAWTLINGAPTNANSTDVKEIRELLAETETQAFQSVLSFRKSFRNAAQMGCSVVELTGNLRDPKAILEMKSVYREIFGEDWIPAAGEVSDE